MMTNYSSQVTGLLKDYSVQLLNQLRKGSTKEEAHITHEYEINEILDPVFRVNTNRMVKIDSLTITGKNAREYDAGKASV